MPRFMPVAVALLSVLLYGCTPSPPVDQSRDQLWAKYGNQSIDSVLMAMGPPSRESRLTDGSRLLTYQYSSVYDYGSPYQHQTGCELTMLAKSPGYKVKNIAMQGGNYECSLLVQGHIGVVTYPYVPPPPPFYPYHPVYR